jgi:hypothetical protein
MAVVALVLERVVMRSVRWKSETTPRDEEPTARARGTEVEG